MFLFQGCRNIKKISCDLKKLEYINIYDRKENYALENYSTDSVSIKLISDTTINSSPIAVHIISIEKIKGKKTTGWLILTLDSLQEFSEKSKIMVELRGKTFVFSKIIIKKENIKLPYSFDSYDACIMKSYNLNGVKKERADFEIEL